MSISAMAWGLETLDGRMPDWIKGGEESEGIMKPYGKSHYLH